MIKFLVSGWRYSTWVPLSGSEAQTQKAGCVPHTYPYQFLNLTFEISSKNGLWFFKFRHYREYIELEIQLREFDRCRTLYQKFLEFAPENCTTWIKFAELETILGDPHRARAIFELAIEQRELDMPEVLWKTYIDFEVDLGEIDNARSLYR